MKRELIHVNFAYEYGDHSLPHLKDLVRDVPDKEKSKILSYLKTNCIMACPGIIRDSLNPDNIIGSGNIYSDGKYYWNDALFGYVDKYNIEIPEEFRSFIIQNYYTRMKRHALLKAIDLVEIKNVPCLKYSFFIKIYKQGLYKYKNNTNCTKGVTGKISADDAHYIIDPIMTELFCYDFDSHGSYSMDGYHWQVRFYKNEELIYKTDGWSDEDKWRYIKFREILNFIERFIPYELGTDYMNYDI